MTPITKHSLAALFLLCALSSCSLFGSKKGDADYESYWNDYYAHQSKDSLPTDSSGVQRIDSQVVFSNTVGIQQEGITFYETDGYAIFDQIYPVAFNEAGINEIKKEYAIGEDATPLQDSTFPTAKIFSVTLKRTEKTVESGVFYLLPLEEGEVRVIGLQTLGKRDEPLEKFMVQAITRNSIPENVYIPQEIDSIHFAGRYIVLGRLCRWMKPHNVQCPGKGQINWSEFRTLGDANEMIHAQFDLTANQTGTDVSEIKIVDILFEGQSAQAIQVSYKIAAPSILLGGSNVLITYYVAAPVRGKYVGCVLSHYDDEAPKNQLPALLSEVMQLK